MKILIAHNYYGSEAPSGENIAVNAEIEMLAKYNDILLFTRDSDEIRGRGLLGAIRGGVSTPWNHFELIRLKKIISKFKPDILHVHNSFPLLSPSIFYGDHFGQAQVLTLHNYRLLCPAAIPMRSQKPCHECIEVTSVIPSLKYGCYRSSRIATFPLAISVELHRRINTWSKKIDAFIALNEFQKDLLVMGGLQSNNIHIKPNFIRDGFMNIPYDQRRGSYVYVGRLSAEKGVKTLIDAWIMWGSDAPQLNIVGDGPLKPELQKMSEGLPIKFHGYLPAHDAHNMIMNAKLLILPSQCYEGFPMVIAQSFSAATPVIVSNLGPLPRIVEDGITGCVFEASNANSLLNVLQKIYRNSALLTDMSIAARNKYLVKYTEEVNYNEIMNIYELALINRSKKLH